MLLQTKMYYKILQNKKEGLFITNNDDNTVGKEIG